MVRPSGFEPPTFCSGGSHSHIKSITYANHGFSWTFDFPGISAPFVVFWWGNWWGSFRLAIRAPTRASTRFLGYSESRTEIAGGIQ